MYLCVTPHPMREGLPDLLKSDTQMFTGMID